MMLRCQMIHLGGLYFGPRYAQRLEQQLLLVLIKMLYLFLL